MSVNWYAVNTKPHQEHQAEQNLERIGVEAFSPLLERRKVVRRKIQTVVGPLFPGYIFARFDAAAGSRGVRFARGVRKIVSFGPAPEPVDGEIIEAIRQRLSGAYLVVPRPVFQAGQTVHIQEGPLKDLHAVFEREMSDHQRVVLLLRTLASQWRVVVPIELVAN